MVANLLGVIEMRKISRLASKALMNHEKFKQGNTRVEVDSDCTAYLKLFGNTIAVHNNDGTLNITNCGYSTVTTKDRLNALPSVHIQQRNWDWFLNGEEWNGGWITVISGTSMNIVDESKAEYIKQQIIGE